MGRWAKAMYGTKHAPQIWSEEVRRKMKAMRCHASAEYPKPERQVHMVAQIDDFLCVAIWVELDSLYYTLTKRFDFRSIVVRGGRRGQVLEWSDQVVGGGEL